MGGAYGPLVLDNEYLPHGRHDNTAELLQEWHTAADPSAPTAGAADVGDIYGQESESSTHGGGGSVDCKRKMIIAGASRFLRVT